MKEIILKTYTPATDLASNAAGLINHIWVTAVTNIDSITELLGLGFTQMKIKDFQLLLIPKTDTAPVLAVNIRPTDEDTSGLGYSGTPTEESILYAGGKFVNCYGNKVQYLRSSKPFNKDWMEIDALHSGDEQGLEKAYITLKSPSTLGTSTYYYRLIPIWTIAVR